MTVQLDGKESKQAIVCVEVVMMSELEEKR